MKHKLFTLLFALLASIGTMHGAVVNGTCGTNLTWTLNTKDSTLVIEGSGEMTSKPWIEYKNYIKTCSLPNALTSIANSAFSRCSNLSVVNIPNSVTKIGDGAFAYCYALTSISIPNGIIGDEAFCWCHGLVSVTIGNGVTSIGNSAFYGCSGITSVVIGNNVQSIGSSAFCNCWHLTSISIPNSVTSIGSGAFNSCSNLISINLPNGLTQIEMGTFANCGLSSIIIPDNVTKIGWDAFYGCSNSNFLSVTIPNSVTEIGKGAFANCEYLQCLNIGSGIVSIGESAFDEHIYTLILHSTTPPQGGLNCGIAPTNCNLYVPQQSIGVYQNSIWWEDFQSIRSVDEIEGCYTLPPTPIASSYLVQFVDWNGEILSSKYVDKGTAAVAPANPTREGYTFVGWDKDFSNVIEDMIITAQYKINRFIVEFLDWNDNVLKSDSVDWNTAAVAPADPTRKGYTFIGWDKDFANVKSDLTIRALYELGESNNFSIIFNNKDGNELLSNDVIIKVPVAPEIIGFTFLGWRPIAAIIESNIIEIEAVYEASGLTDAPAIMSNPTNTSQKLIRDGNVYILRGDRTYTLTGTEVK